MSDDPSKVEYSNNNIEFKALSFHRVVFPISSLLIAAFIIFTLLYPNYSSTLINGSRGYVLQHFDWAFMIGANIFVLFGLFLAVSPYAKVRLGGKDAKPEYSRWSWFAMLFAAGMGIGLMFWCVAEPVGYFTQMWGGSGPETWLSPLGVVAGTPEAKQLSLVTAIFHWGIHPWAAYGVVGLSLAYFGYNKGLPFTIRSTFQPLLGKHAFGIPGDIIDILAVFATMFGLATSLGFGAQQAASGLNYVFGVENTLSTQVAIIFLITIVASYSVLRGLDKGIKRLSQINLVLAICLAVFVFLAGSTVAIINNVGTGALGYIKNIIPLSNWIGREDGSFVTSWTVFFWAWWIAWSPFVGLFIARISKGRTVREFILAVLIIPTLVAIVWMSIFGGEALIQIVNNVGDLKTGITDVSITLFRMLHALPLSSVSSVLAIVLVLIFFVTSFDSGALVVDNIAAGGKTDSVNLQRLLWVVLEGVIATILLYVGGSKALGALQSASVSTGLPFTFVLLAMCVSLILGLRQSRQL